ncbi:membrane dipeptidase [Sulfitobacter mediterraneus]|uniref:dipeptidase n=1 Tax=Sulfitobacter mediterraneus TaxID=83219 RepID=UPI00193A6D3F|nr:membrane dipeptidase [Sulfitobacter mediterraneus]MBM1557948.1 membrane dipeptidase [Sulfitobacter mediterraneus]MBM1568677.1 membrane dipeptidase [Sulfitobacter mediterraneus]MBM1573121.1 membrane dipeptidase [Sulfitobacter mediterraneus]MBM1576322.1 membrane dipeptidase [Sulfitobacter mediterraneus]MBM1580906.1 membrane dipeptidase [Sulfitobacter mediterraneus]
MRTFGKWLGRFLALIVVLAVGFFTFAPAYVEKSRNAVADHDPYPVSDAARALHDTLVVGDLHADPLLWNRDLSKRHNYGQVDIPRLIEGGVAVQVFTAVTKSPAGQNYDENSAEAFDNITALAIGQLWPMRTWGSLLERALYQAEKLHRVEGAMPEQFRILRSRADLDQLLADRANGMQVVGGLLGIEGAHPLEGDLANLDKLVEAGHRLIALQHFFDNKLGGSLHGEGNQGLTEFGRSVVAEVARRGLLLDLAHSSPQVARDVLDMTDIPLIVSHSGIHGHCAVKRNFLDDLMQDIAATGGVIGMGYWGEVACGNITPSGIADMIVKAIEVVGEDHVALGSDFDGSVSTAFDTSELPALTHALLEAGVTEAQIRKVMGENMMRVLRARLQ